MAANTDQSGDVTAWNQVVRGGGGAGEPDPVAAPSVKEHDLSPVKTAVVSSPEDMKKPVWNRKVNNGGDVESSSVVVSPVMGTAWPALGESTKAAVKSSSSDSLKTLSDGLVTPAALQVTGSSSPSHKQASANNVNTTSTPNHAAPAKQKSMKRGGGSSSANATANGVVSQPPPTSQDAAVEAPHSTSGKPGNAAEQPSPRDHGHKESPRGGLGGNDHHHQRGSYRRGNGGQHHNNYKRDHDRGNQEWNQHSRSFNNRDTNLQSPRGFARGFIRPTVHTTAPFIPQPMPVPVQSFGNNMMYPDVPSPVIYVPGPPDSLRAMPFVPPLPPQMYFAVDPLLHANIVSQIDYYFSNENLVRDTYLRRNMDEQGWVSASLIAGFKKVSQLTDNVQLILDAMRNSTLVEVQGDKIRRRNDWMKWIMPAAGQYSNPSSPQAANHDGMVSQLHGLALHESTSTTQVPEEFTSQSQQAGEERDRASQ
ncbi:RNA-binding protein Lupus La [Artemisia annua]|uniref:RNA-binding protein Lupus La n=2 Tax=Artemisia annua TaxID=35608 RepID=A0A2U1NPX5_ARTAN|nr:RNA-binding protein Lupus La [Artemisia annua]